MRQILLTIFIVAFWGCAVSTQRTNSWIKVTSLDGFLSSSLGTIKTAWNVLRCGRVCVSDSDCQSYFFNAGKSVSNCQLHDVVFQTMSSMVPTPNVTYFIPANHPMPEFQPVIPVSSSTPSYHVITSQTPAQNNVPETTSQTNVPETTSQTNVPETTSQTNVIVTTPPEVNFSIPTFQCHERDSLFRTVRLSDNTTYTYRFDQSYFMYDEAVSSCNNQSARLARITTDAKLELFAELMLCEEFTTFQRVYVDGMYNGGWHWYDEPEKEANFAPSFWAPGNPFDFSHACSRLTKPAQWHGENWSCTLYSPSVCEK